MASDYYTRTATATSGGPAFGNAADGRNEDAAKAAIEAAWNVSMVRYGGRFNPIDWYALRDGRIVAYVELKTRSHAPEAFPTVFLNQRKWLALTMSFVYTAVPSIFAVRFAGGEVRWVEVDRIDARKIEVAGCRKLVKSRTDREPVIHVPIADMHVLKTRRETP